MAAFSLPPPVLALMERTLFATSATAKTSYLEKTINDARNEAAAQLRSLETDSPDPVAYALGAIDVMSVMLVRARERHDGDRAFALARRKHVLPMLRALAKSKEGLRPSELADTLGLNRPKVSDLLGKMDTLQLTARSPLTDGGQDRRRQITPGGKLILDSLDPAWSLPRKDLVEAWRATLESILPLYAGAVSTARPTKNHADAAPSASLAFASRRLETMLLHGTRDDAVANVVRGAWALHADQKGPSHVMKPTHKDGGYRHIRNLVAAP